MVPEKILVLYSRCFSLLLFLLGSLLVFVTVSPIVNCIDTLFRTVYCVCDKKLLCTMDPFSVKSFVDKPSLKVVRILKKLQLTALEQHFKLELTATMKMSELKQLVIDHLVDTELVSDEMP